MGTCRVFVDMDGVVVDFMDAAIRAGDPRSEDFGSIYKAMLRGDSAWDIPELDIDLIKKAESSVQWWANLDKLPWADKLIGRLQDRDVDVAFLTSYGNHNEYNEIAQAACAGKVIWCHQHYPDVPLILAYDKYLCANPNTLLIDDSEHKLTDFVYHGGHVFLWPNQYKLMSMDICEGTVFNELNTTIDHLIEERQ